MRVGESRECGQSFRGFATQVDEVAIEYFECCQEVERWCREESRVRVVERQEGR